MPAAKRAKELLDKQELDEVRDVSAGAATFYVFVSLIPIYFMWLLQADVVLQFP